MELDNIRPYALILIYPDGLVENVLINDRTYHLEYFVKLRDKSERFKKLCKEKDIFIPSDIDSITDYTHYDLDVLLANEGLLSITSSYVDEETKNAYPDEIRDYYIIMPQKLTDEQIELLQRIIDNNNMGNCYYGVFSNWDIVDI